MEAEGKKDTRERLLEAATELLWERSYTATGVDQLCARAKANKGSFYHFFLSKNDLAVHAIKDAWIQHKARLFDPVFKESKEGLKCYAALFRTIEESKSDFVQSNGMVRGCLFGNIGQEMARQDESLCQALKEIYDEHYDYFQLALERAVELGEIPPGDNRQRAIMVFALLEGSLLLSKVANDLKFFFDAAKYIPILAASPCKAETPALQ